MGKLDDLKGLSNLNNSIRTRNSVSFLGKGVPVYFFFNSNKINMCCCSQGKPQTVTYLDKWQLLWSDILAGWAEVKDLSYFSSPTVIYQCVRPLSTVLLFRWSIVPLCFCPPSSSVLNASSLLKNQHSKVSIQLAVTSHSSVWERELATLQTLKWLSKKSPQI